MPEVTMSDMVDRARAVLADTCDELRARLADIRRGISEQEAAIEASRRESDDIEREITLLEQSLRVIAGESVPSRDLRAEVVVALRESPRSPSGVANAIQATLGDVQGEFRRLEREGVIERAGGDRRGVYRVKSEAAGDPAGAGASAG